HPRVITVDARAGHELFDLVGHDLLRVTAVEHRMVTTRQLDETRTRNVPGDVPAVLHGNETVCGDVHDQRRSTDNRQDRTRIGCVLLPEDRADGARRHRLALDASQVTYPRVVDLDTGFERLQESSGAPDPLDVLDEVLVVAGLHACRVVLRPGQRG